MKTKLQNYLPILKGKLEKAPLALFTDKRYKEIRKAEFGNQCGVYALYNQKGGLYYVGRASNMKSRLYNHLQNQHSKRWHYFSVYFTNSEQQARELESIFISIDKPKGNTQNPSLKTLDTGMRRRIMKNMKIVDQEKRKFGTMGVKRKSKKASQKKLNRVKSLKANNKKASVVLHTMSKGSSKVRNKGDLSLLVNLFETDKPLKANYKGQEYRAMLLTSGKVLYNGKEYDSPSKAGKVARGLETNGWTFWQIQDHKNNWITLSALREKKRALKRVA